VADDVNRPGAMELPLKHARVGGFVLKRRVLSGNTLAVKDKCSDGVALESRSRLTARFERGSDGANPCRVKVFPTTAVACDVAGDVNRFKAESFIRKHARRKRLGSLLMSKEITANLLAHRVFSTKLSASPLLAMWRAM